MPDHTTNKPVRKRPNRKRQPIDQRFWKYVDKSGDCWLWTGATRNFGYGVLNTGGHNGHAAAAHRVSWVIHFGDIPPDMCICHHCDNPLCVNPAHLFLGTRADNNRDMYQKGRYKKTSDNAAKGESHGMARLTEKEVLEIRSRHAATHPTLRDLAVLYNVSLQSIHRIVHRKSWKHI